MKDTPLDRLRHVYANHTTDGIRAIQAEEIERYRRCRQNGNDNKAQVILATINDFSKLIEERETK